MEQLRKFARYFKPYKGTILLGILCILASMSFGLFIPYMVGQAVDDLGLGVTREKIIYYPLVILGISAMSGVFLFLQRRLLINTSRHIEFDMRQDFYASLVGQSMQYFHETRVGDLMGSGTISGATDDARGSLLEITWNGANPLAVDGGTRTFLEDGDEVTMRGWCQGEGYRIGFGMVTGTIAPALPV